MRGILAIGLLLPLLACSNDKPASATESADKPAEPSITAEALAVTDPTARVHQQPDVPRSRAWKGLYVVRVIKQVGEWVEVETVPALLMSRDAPQLCHKLPAGLSPFRLRFFLHRNHLRPVLRKFQEFTFIDGTRVAALPGLALEPLTDAPGGLVWYRTQSSFPVEVPLDPARVGWWFESVGTGSSRDSVVYVQYGSSVEVGGRQHVAPAVDYIGSPGAYARKEHAGRPLVSMAVKCQEMDAFVDPANLADVGRGGYVNYRNTRPLMGPTAIKGAAIYWEDGSPAGSVEFDTSMGESETESSGRPCFERSVIRDGEPWSEDATVTLCFDEKGLRRPTAD